MSYNTEEFQDLAAGYAVNALSQEDLIRFQQLLAEAPAEDLAEAGRLWETAMTLSATVDEMAPSSKVRKNLMKEIRGGSSSKSSAKGFGSWFTIESPLLSYGIPLVLAVISLSLLYSNQGLMKQNKVLMVKNSLFQEELDKSQRVISFLAQKDLETVIMAGLDPSPNANVKLVWNPKTKEAYMQFTDLPVTASDKDYQLWMIKDGVPISAAVFSLEKSRQGDFQRIEYLNLETLKEAQAFAITLEPKGGSPAPTGAMYVKGSAI